MTFTGKLFLSLMLCAVPVFAGDTAGHGGGAVVCKDASVALLDFWEAEALKGLKIRESTAPIKQQLNDALKLLAEKGQTAYTDLLATYVFDLYKRVEVDGIGFIAEGIAIAPPKDAMNQFIKKGCDLAGLALFNDDYETLDIDGALYNSLSLTGKAGLFFHEGIYRLLRKRFKVKDSIVARNITACVFAEKTCPELSFVYEIPPNAPLYLCTLAAPDPTVYSFYLFQPRAEQEAAKHWRFQVVDVKLNEETPTRSYFDFEVEGDVAVNGYFFAKPFPGHRPTTYKTKSSAERWQDIGLSLDFVVDFDEDQRLTINSQKAICSEQ